MRVSLGVDVGGTFTDLVAIAEDGSFRVVKVLSTPQDQSVGVMRALGELGSLESVERLVHGSTVVTNLLLERTGARVILCATRGATDILDLRRQDRASIYDLTMHHPPALVPPDDRIAVSERMTPHRVEVALTIAECERVAGAALRQGPEAIVVALLHSPSSPEHERLLGATLASCGATMPVVLSSDVLPEIREYERTATTVAEAYARPRVESYLRNLANRVANVSTARLNVMTSNGGLLTVADAASHAAAMALSGPAGGVVGAAFIARQLGELNALSIDIGGTSADAGLVLNGAALSEPGGSVAGVPIALPRVLVETVSAGGGSIGWRDDGGALRVGPRSAGASPGPAAFGRGGKLPTVTDAHIVLGHIPALPISDDISLDYGLARAALEPLAAELQASVEEVAAAMIAIANAEMARALRRVSVERGVDPASLVLVAFGGGGPLHGCDLAELLGISRVVVPPAAGALSAFGLALASERREVMCSVLRRSAECSVEFLREMRADLSARAGDALHKEFWLRARYVGQGHEMDVEFLDAEDGGTIAERFAEVHAARFGYKMALEVEFISARHAAFGEEWNVDWNGTGAGRASDADGVSEVEVGPATVVLPDATLLVRSGWKGVRAANGCWVIDRSSAHDGAAVSTRREAGGDTAVRPL